MRHREVPWSVDPAQLRGFTMYEAACGAFLHRIPAGRAPARRISGRATSNDARSVTSAVCNGTETADALAAASSPHGRATL
jgi:hypothetical protein